MPTTDQIKYIDPTKALNEIHESVRQLSFMKQHCEALIEQLDVKIRLTYEKAPSSRPARKTYDLGRLEGGVPSVRERYLERLIWTQWSYEMVATRNSPFYGDICKFIQTYQLPLKEAKADDGWGMIDLVGVTANLMPVVIELKQEDSKENPLRMLMESLIYACVLKKAWNEGVLRTEWVAAMEDHGLSFADAGGFKIPIEIEEIPIILLAPEQFWNQKIGQPERRSPGKVFENAWPPFCELAGRCQKHGFSIHFVSFDIHHDSQGREEVSEGKSISPRICKEAGERAAI